MFEARLDSSWLAASVQDLVGLLRETLPAVLELELVRGVHGGPGVSIDAFAKSISWFRIMYGTRHAIDIRFIVRTPRKVQDNLVSLSLMHHAHYMALGGGWLAPQETTRRLVMMTAASSRRYLACGSWCCRSLRNR